MQHTRLISKFENWRKSSNNVMKKSELIDQIELFQFVEDEDFDSNTFLSNLIESDSKYSRLSRRSKDGIF